MAASSTKKTFIGLMAFVMVLIAVFWGLIWGINAGGEDDNGADGKKKCHCNIGQKDDK